MKPDPEKTLDSSIEKEFKETRDRFIEVTERYSAITGYKCCLLEYSPDIIDLGLDIQNPEFVLPYNQFERLKEFLSPYYEVIDKRKKVTR
jgi:hypothetical protein